MIALFGFGLGASNAQTETRGITKDGDTYAVFFDGRTMYAPSNTVTRSAGAGVNFSQNGVGIATNLGKSTTTVEIKGRLIPKGARVNVFPRRGGFYGDNVSIPGTNKTYANNAQKEVLSNKKEECILIGYDNMWYYVPRRCLIQ